MKKTGIYNSFDVLSFADSIVFRPCVEGWLVVSVESGNWIVLQSDYQKESLERLISGCNIGDLYKDVTSERQLCELKKLLTAIKAREFATTDKTIELKKQNNDLTLNCYLTNACNLHCKHCFMFSGQKLLNELTSLDWIQILSEFREHNGLQVTFTGGEPMMVDDFPKILMHAHSIGLDTTVLTNGTLWDENSIRSMAPYISEVQISIDGVDDISNSMVRGKGYFEDTLRTIIQFANNNVRTSVATTFTYQNLQSNIGALYADMVKYINSQCSANAQIRFKLSKKILNGRTTNYSVSDNERYYETIAGIESKVYPNARLTNFIEDHLPNLIMQNCGFGGISIAANGEVYVCNRILELESYGNIREHDITYFLEIGRKLSLSTSVEHLIPCKDCYLRYICGGGCRIDDCNFRGKMKGVTEPLYQEKCNSDFITNIERKMIDSFRYYYII